VSGKTVILGYDAVSSLGTDLETQWQRAVRGESGIGPLTRFPHACDFPVRVAGQVDEVDIKPFPFLQPREMAHWTSPIFKYALLVVHRALKMSGLEITPDIAPRVAITFSSAVGGLDAVLKADRQMIADIAAAPEAQAADHLRAEVRNDVAVQVGRHQNVVVERVLQQPHAHRVDVGFVHRDLWEVFRDLAGARNSPSVARTTLAL